MDQLPGTMDKKILGDGDPRDQHLRINDMISAVSLAGASCDYRAPFSRNGSFGARSKRGTRRAVIMGSPDTNPLDAPSMAACLVAVAKSGDRTAFEALFRHFARKSSPIY